MREVKIAPVGMTAGYLSSTVKVECSYSADAPGVPTKFVCHKKEKTQKRKMQVPTKFVVKLWPDFELMPPEARAETKKEKAIPSARKHSMKSERMFKGL